MTDYEVMHIAVVPLINPDENLVRDVATVIDKNPYDTRLLLAGKVPKVIGHYDSMQIAESVTQNLRDLGLTAIACKDSELYQYPQTFKAQTMEFGEKDVLFRDSSSHEKRMVENNVFIILVGRIETPVEAEKIKPQNKLSLTKTLLMGGIPIWRKADEKTITQSMEAEYFVRLYEPKSPNLIVEILQHHMNYSFLGIKIAVSSLTNFNTIVSNLREIFPRALFDNRLTKSSTLPTSSSQVWQDIEANCKLIYLFHTMDNDKY